MLLVFTAAASIYAYANPERRTITEIGEACPICPAFSEHKVTELDYTQAYIFGAVTGGILVGWIVYYVVLILVPKTRKSS